MTERVDDVLIIGGGVIGCALAADLSAFSVSRFASSVPAV